MKRLLIIADTHTNHQLGLTPPEYQNIFYKEIQSIGWNFYSKTVKELNADAVLFNGDIIDLANFHDKTEFITTNTEHARQMAIEVIYEIPNINNIEKIFIRGTGVHTKQNEEQEDLIAENFDCVAYDSKKFKINGTIIHARHTSSKGGTAYGSVTPLQRSAVIQILNDISKNQVKADLYIRSHCHDFNIVQRSLFTAMTTPALQFAGSTYGRGLTGFYDFGISWIDFDDEGNFNIYHKILKTSTGHKEEIMEIR